MSALIPVDSVQPHLMISTDDAWVFLVKMTLDTVAVSSARIYEQTFHQWQDWCARQSIEPLHLHAVSVSAYLVGQAVSQNTRQRQLSALRKLARVLATLDYNNAVRRAAYESLLLIRAPHEGVVPKERQTHSLSPTQAIKVLGVWSSERLLHQRNCALIALLFLTGVRRSEAVALCWSDLDLEEGILQVRHGKGDTQRSAAIAGEAALAALKRWRASLLAEVATDRTYVFCAIGKGDKIGPDAALSDQAVYYVVKQTQKLSGVIFSPHDARRTFITEALTTGALLADIQAQAGHKQESTTLRYAKPVDARQRRQRLRLRYGDD